MPSDGKFCVMSHIVKWYCDGCNGIKRKASAMSLLAMCASSVHSCMSLIASDNRSYSESDLTRDMYIYNFKKCQITVDADVGMLEFTEERS